MAFPESFVWGELAAMSRADTLAAKRYFAKGPHRQRLDPRQPRRRSSSTRGGGLIDAWPAQPDENEYSRPCRDSNVETLLVGGTLDFATPPVRARRRELLPHLPNGHQVVLSGLGHTTSFWSDAARGAARAC